MLAATGLAVGAVVAVPLAMDRIARTLSAWSVTSGASIAALTALWGLLATPFLLPRHDHTLQHEPALAGVGANVRSVK